MDVVTQGPLYAWYEIAGIVLAIPVAIAIVWGILRTVSHLSLVHEAIAGREATAVSEKVPSMIDRFQDVNAHLAKQDRDLAAIKAELSYNGGGSTKDQVRKLGTDVAVLQRGQRAAARTAADVSADLHATD